MYMPSHMLRRKVGYIHPGYWLVETKRLYTLTYIYKGMPWFKQPILLNYTGKTCHFNVKAIPAMNPYRTIKRDVIVYPPIGYVRVDYVDNEEWEDAGSFVRTANVKIIGLPEPMKDTWLLVSVEVAMMLSASRHDLLVPDKVNMETDKEIFFDGLKKFYFTH